MRADPAITTHNRVISAKNAAPHPACGHPPPRGRAFHRLFISASARTRFFCRSYSANRPCAANSGNNPHRRRSGSAWNTDCTGGIEAQNTAAGTPSPDRRARGHSARRGPRFCSGWQGGSRGLTEPRFEKSTSMPSFSNNGTTSDSTHWPSADAHPLAAVVAVVEEPRILPRDAVELIPRVGGGQHVTALLPVPWV